MSNKSKTLLVIIGVLVILVVAGFLFISKINKPTKSTPEIIAQIKKQNALMLSLVEQNESMLKDVQDKYDQRKIKEALDAAILLNQNVSQISDESLKFTDEIKNMLSVVENLESNQRAIVLQLAQNQITSITNLKDYCAYADLVRQGIAAEYEAELDKTPINLNVQPAELLKEMQNSLQIAKQNLSAASDALKDL
jgi:ABC-type Na+ efflux pump permease subunit